MAFLFIWSSSDSTKNTPTVRELVYLHNGEFLIDPEQRAVGEILWRLSFGLA